MDEPWNGDPIARAQIQVYTCNCNATMSRCLPCRLAHLLLLRAEERYNDVSRQRKPALDIVSRYASPGGMQTVASSSEQDFGPNGDLGFGGLTLEDPDDATNKELAMDLDRDHGMDISTKFEIDFSTDLAMDIDTNLEIDVDMDIDLDVDMDIDMDVDMDIDMDIDMDVDVNLSINLQIDIDMK